jgi:hypothetical protein
MHVAEISTLTIPVQKETERSPTISFIHSHVKVRPHKYCMIRAALHRVSGRRRLEAAFGIHGGSDGRDLCILIKTYTPEVPRQLPRKKFTAAAPLAAAFIKE